MALERILFLKFINNVVNLLITFFKFNPYIYQKFFCWIFPMDNLEVKMVVVK